MNTSVEWSSVLQEAWSVAATRSEALQASTSPRLGTQCVDFGLPHVVGFCFSYEHHEEEGRD